MLDYEFMRIAFAAGGIVAVVSGAVGYFLVLRNSTFAGHALSHVGFAGATGAVLIGASPFWGLLAFTLGAGAGIGLLGERLRGRDVAVGVVLTLALGCGVLFLHLYTSYATQVSTLLFGNLFGVSRATLWDLLALAALSIVALALISRPLLFATLEPELAQAKGVSLRAISVLFLVIVAVAVAEAVQVVGVLLVFALMVCPPAAALRLSSRLGTGIALAMALAVLEAWAGTALAYLTDWPPTSWIVFLSCGVYFLSLARRASSGDRGELRAA